MNKKRRSHRQRDSVLRNQAALDQQDRLPGVRVIGVCVSQRNATFQCPKLLSQWYQFGAYRLP
jgi:hypothetical protein